MWDICVYKITSFMRLKGKTIKRFDDIGEVLDTPVIYNTEPVATDRI